MLEEDNNCKNYIQFRNTEQRKQARVRGYRYQIYNDSQFYMIVDNWSSIIFPFIILLTGAKEM